MKTPPIKRIKANGIQFAYFEVGEGPLVLCLHGFPDTPHSFLPMMHKLAESGYRVVAPFMRGYSPTAKAEDDDYSVLSLAKDALGIIDALAMGDEKAIVIGHDWGGFAAYTAANLQPEKVSVLVQLCMPHMHVSNFTWAQIKKSWYVWYFQLPGLPEKKLVENNFSFIDRLYNKWSPNWELPSGQLIEIKKALAVEGGVKAALAYYRAMIRGVTKEQWKVMSEKTTVPTLLVAGEADGAVGMDQFKDISTAYTNQFRFLSYPKIGHFPQCENTEALTSDILEFINQCK